MMSPLRAFQATSVNFSSKLRDFWALIKGLQTGLLLVTGLAGFMSACCPVLRWQKLLALTGSLFLVISGSTILNMWYDRDIDARMRRTCWRPLPSGRISPRESLMFGLLLSILGVGWALGIHWLYGTIVFAGLFCDVVVYTMWLKRRTAWSIAWGGIAGGMPILAGRALGTGRIDWVGLSLASGVLLWIPIHIITINMRHDRDYQRADIPTFPSTYGVQATRVIIAVSSLGTALAIAFAVIGISMTWGYLRLLAVLSAGMLALSVTSIVRPSERLNFGLFKYASVFMLSSMLLIIAEAI